MQRKASPGGEQTEGGAEDKPAKTSKTERKPSSTEDNG